ncbi:hypothetical protein EMIHUDRAFT_250014 [Emiliania huxleyi CCMP1516]|uniref:Fungal lipase-type domain-containing protein n=2 Tax=Emiliania huxleyi TaxID=2903 RepID=A0A0D3I4L7_EMIH1|nr:hypothetical protein EMIHUDRAFT_250014 [Emiliania huxleyi CCMP1516]EOD06202.1 hypothetical protein EMIHUDRAFT_250014 [Emiliania huxleyi CCMP1516]|eukprot:XP_005758631.1 hypothetical protein EMIHUDRAFT_250014 [Emiliania huxleyi CCMP1516]
MGSPSLALSHLCCGLCERHCSGDCRHTETGDGALLITGHSLGGALAMLAARDLGPALASKMSIYTFGNPRVGDAALAEDTDAATRECEGPFRCIVEDDVVARLPRGKQANRIYDYRHAGTTALLEGGSVRLAKADGEDCPLAEVDPLYEGVFPPILNFGALRRSNLAEFAAEIGRLVRGRLVVAHLSKSYQGALSKLGGGES